MTEENFAEKISRPNSRQIGPIMDLNGDFW